MIGNNICGLAGRQILVNMIGKSESVSTDATTTRSGTELAQCHIARVAISTSYVILQFRSVFLSAILLLIISKQHI